MENEFNPSLKVQSSPLTFDKREQLFRVAVSSQYRTHIGLKGSSSKSFLNTM